MINIVCVKVWLEKLGGKKWGWMLPRLLFWKVARVLDGKSGSFTYKGITLIGCERTRGMLVNG